MANDSTHLRAADLRAIYLLVGECCELGADPRIWRLHLLERLDALFGTVGGVDIEASFDSTEECGTAKVDVAITLDHFTAHEREILTQCLSEMPLAANPLGLDVVSRCRPNQALAAVRRERVRGRDWERAAIQTDYFGPVGWDDSMFGVVKLTNGFRCYCFNRRAGEAPIPLRAARMLERVAAELAQISPLRLAPMSHTSLCDLPPRLREVLQCLAEGDNEKQIAARLRVSRSTVHEYVRRLFKRFSVSSRGALLLRAARQLHAFELASDSSAGWLYQSHSPD